MLLSSHCLCFSTSWFSSFNSQARLKTPILYFTRLLSRYSMFPSSFLCLKSQKKANKLSNSSSLCFARTTSLCPGLRGSRCFYIHKLSVYYRIYERNKTWPSCCDVYLSEVFKWSSIWCCCFFRHGRPSWNLFRSTLMNDTCLMPWSQHFCQATNINLTKNPDWSADLNASPQ